MKRSIITLMLFALFITAFSQYEKFTPADPDAEDSFGWCLAIDGDYMVIGNVYDDDMGIQSGAIYIYKYDGTQWNFQQKISASDGGYAEYFGYNVQISGNRIIVGAYRGNDNMGVDVGSAYIYEFDGVTWNEVAILQPEGGEYDDRFGQYVDIHGDYAIVGANGDDDIDFDAGAAYLYSYNGATWNLVEKITPATLDYQSIFGNSVSITDEYMAIGAALDVENGVKSGTVYMYSFDGANWNFDEILVPDDASEEQYFSRAVALDGENLLVGSYYDDVVAENSGSAYIFIKEATGWVQTQKIFPTNGHASDLFASSVSIDGDNLLCGSQFYFEEGYYSGAAFYWHWNGSTWEYASTIKQPDPVPEAKFGMSLAISGDHGLIGAPFDDENGYRSGAAYMYDLSSLLGVDDYLNSDDYVIYPTISDGVFNIGSSLKGQEIREITVTNILGGVVMRDEMDPNVSTMSLDLSYLGSGSYIITISNENIFFTKKVILK